jgi:hypothetical protein
MSEEWLYMAPRQSAKGTWGLPPGAHQGIMRILRLLPRLRHQLLSLSLRLFSVPFNICRHARSG